jgi:hypothetical protein
MWIIPTGVNYIYVDVIGASGGFHVHGSGYSNGIGRGGRVQAYLNVTGISVMYIYVGGRGHPTGDVIITSGEGGWNGGGNGSFCSQNSGGGGGASDIRINGQALTDRIVVAGGGGGNGYCCQGRLLNFL